MTSSIIQVQTIFVKKNIDKCGTKNLKKNSLFVHTLDESQTYLM